MYWVKSILKHTHTLFLIHKLEKKSLAGKEITKYIAACFCKCRVSFYCYIKGDRARAKIEKREEKKERKGEGVPFRENGIQFQGIRKRTENNV